jgi:hypothetical protein
MVEADERHALHWPPGLDALRGRASDGQIQPAFDSYHAFRPVFHEHGRARPGFQIRMCTRTNKPRL